MKNLVLLHGALGTKQQLSSLMQLLESEFKVFSFDFSGHGSKADYSGSLDFELFTADIHEFLQTQGIEKANFFGYSMGGYAAVCYAAKYPDSVDRIFTLATKYRWDSQGVQNELKMLDPAKIKEKVPPFAAHLAKVHGDQNWEKLLQNTAQMMKLLGEKAPINDEFWKKFNHSLLISVGDRDTTAGLEDSLTTYRKLANGKFLVFPGLAHAFEKVPVGFLAETLKNYLNEN